MSKSKSVKIRLVFADAGAFHEEEIEVPRASVEAHDRLIDCLSEDPEVLERLHVDLSRLVSAFRQD